MKGKRMRKKNMTRTLMNPTSLPHSILMINCYQLLAHKVQHQIVRFLVSFLLISLKFHCFELFFSYLLWRWRRRKVWKALNIFSSTFLLISIHSFIHCLLFLVHSYFIDEMKIFEDWNFRCRVQNSMNVFETKISFNSG